MKPNQDFDHYHLVFVGAGISSLSCLYRYLKRHDAIGPIAVIEKSNSVGGVLKTSSVDGYVLEHGAQGVLASRKCFAALVKEIGLEERVIAPKRGLSRFLHVPHLHPKGVKTVFPITLNPIKLIKSRILSFAGLCRLFLELFIPRARLVVRDSETIYDFFARRFGKECAENIAIPVATGIWAGGANKIFLKNAFPLLYDMERKCGGVSRAIVYKIIKSLFGLVRDKVEKKSAKKSEKILQQTGLISFPKGMGELSSRLKLNIDILAKDKKIRLDWLLDCELSKIDSVGEVPDFRLYEFTYFLNNKESAARQMLTASNVVYSLRPDLSHEILSHKVLDMIKLKRDLAKLPSHDISVCFLGGTSKSPLPQGFGVLASKSSSDWLGVLYIHSLYPEHVPSGRFLFRVLLGGDRGPRVSNMNDHEVVELSKKRLFELGLVDQSVNWELHEVMKWKRIIYLQGLEHKDAMEAADFGSAEKQGFYFIGNYIHGVSVEDCIDLGSVTASKITFKS